MYFVRHNLKKVNNVIGDVVRHLLKGINEMGCFPFYWDGGSVVMVFCVLDQKLFFEIIIFIIKTNTGC